MGPVLISTLSPRLPSPPNSPAFRRPPRRGRRPLPDGGPRCSGRDTSEGSATEPAPLPLRRCRCCASTRRHLLLGLGAPMFTGSVLPLRQSRAGTTIGAAPDPLDLTMAKSVRPRRPDWYEELYAKAMNVSMGSYEAEIARYKREMFARLRGENKKVLEVGVGTGPNLKYYADAPGVCIYGVDPNKQMEKYAREAAVGLGLPPANFSFIQGIAEDLPVRDNSMDAIIGTLVLCSVNDINTALMEVKRVLKPGGVYIFVEHVAAEDGSLLRLIQTVLDPLQQFVADGCHLTRETGKSISLAGFSDVQINMATISNASIVGPHVYGVAYK